MADEFRAISGARAKLFFEGNIPAGWATNVSANERFNNVRVDVLGSPFTQEIVNSGTTATFSASFVKVFKKSLRKMGFWIDNKSDLGIMQWPAMTAEIFDVSGKVVLYRVHGIMPSSRHMSADRNSVFTEQCEWEAIRVEDVDA